VPGWKVGMAKFMANIAPSFSMANGLDRQNLSHDPATFVAYDADQLVHDRISAILGRDLLTMGSWMIEQANSFSIPLLLMQGSKDHLVSPQATEAFARRVPSELLTYRVWQDFYHETHNELGKEQVLQLMVDWLDQHV
jgi:alpha-beta hydrolase superfamily lysophospholipase